MTNESYGLNQSVGKAIELLDEDFFQGFCISNVERRNSTEEGPVQTSTPLGT